MYRCRQTSSMRSRTVSMSNSFSLNNHTAIQQNKGRSCQETAWANGEYPGLMVITTATSFQPTPHVGTQPITQGAAKEQYQRRCSGPEEIMYNNKMAATVAHANSNPEIVMYQTAI